MELPFISQIKYVKINCEMALNLLQVVKTKSKSSESDIPTYQDTFHPKLTTTFENKPNAIPTFGIRIQHLLNNINLEINHIANNIILKDQNGK